MSSKRHKSYAYWVLHSFVIYWAGFPVRRIYTTFVFNLINPWDAIGN
jgi:hypothetical protein